jgi:hypothetical protein
MLGAMFKFFSASFLIFTCVESNQSAYSLRFKLKDKEWTMIDSTTASVIVGIGASGQFALAGAGNNGIGVFIENYDGNKWSKQPISAGLIMDAAISKNGNLSVLASLLPVFTSNDGGRTYAPLDGIRGTSQSASTFGENSDKFALVGVWLNSNVSNSDISGVLYSTDSLSTWQISSPIPIGYPRYGAFPSDKVWYVSSGIWGEDSSVDNRDKTYLTSRAYTVRNDTSIHFNENKNDYSKPAKKATDPTGWFGAVSKSMDGGKTWVQVLISDIYNDYYYFNGISCINELQCVVVGEGEDSQGGSLTLAFTTFDGGMTWEQSFKSNEYSLMSAYFISTDELWLAGTVVKSGRSLYGQFRKSTNGGKSFDLVQVS